MAHAHPVGGGGAACDDGGTRWRTPPLTENSAMLMMDIHRDAIHGGGVGEVRDDGVGGAAQDEGDENQLSECSWPSSSLQEMPRPVLRGGCSQEAFQSFTQQWDQYARYHSGMDVGELRQQLLNCADGALEPLMYNSLGGKVDTLSQTDLVKQLEQLAVVVVGEDVKQMVVPTVEMLPLSNGQKGGLGGANKKEIPKTFVKCEEPYCQRGARGQGLRTEGVEEPHVRCPQEAGADHPAGDDWEEERPEKDRQYPSTW